MIDGGARVSCPAANAGASARSRSSSALEDPSHRGNGIALGRALIRAVAFDASEAKCRSTRILGASLDLVECHFDHQLRTYVDGDPVACDLELEQLLRLPCQHFVSHAFERLPQHDKAAGHRVSSA